MRKRRRVRRTWPRTGLGGMAANPGGDGRRTGAEIPRRSPRRAISSRGGELGAEIALLPPRDDKLPFGGARDYRGGGLRCANESRRRVEVSAVPAPRSLVGRYGAPFPRYARSWARKSRCFLLGMTRCLWGRVTAEVEGCVARRSRDDESRWPPFRRRDPSSFATARHFRATRGVGRGNRAASFSG